jgi:hypothetical protein
MKYNYEVYKKFVSGDERVRIMSTTSLVDVEHDLDAALPHWSGPLAPFSVDVYDNQSSLLVAHFTHTDDIESWRVGQERSAAWIGKNLPGVTIETTPEKQMLSTEQVKGMDSTLYVKHDIPPAPKPLETIKKAVNPSHYQAYFSVPEADFDLQWLEAMQYLPSFRNPEKFLAAVELQGRKYIDRLGQKDASAQELLKATWYFRFMAAYVTNGNKPIRVKDIPKILGEV